MRRRDFAMGLLLAAAVRAVRAQEAAKQHRIAVITPAGLAADTATGDVASGRRFTRSSGGWAISRDLT